MLKRIGDIARWLRSVNDGCSFTLGTPATKLQPSESGTFTTALTSYDRGPGLH